MANKLELARKLGPQSFSCKELNLATNHVSFKVATEPQKEMSLGQHLDFSI